MNNSGRKGGIIWSLSEDFIDIYLIFTTLLILWIATLTPILRETLLRLIAALVIVLFVPGYSLLAVLFPEAEPPQDAAEEGGAGINILDRLVLSVGSSVILVSLIGLLLNFSPFGLRLLPILVGLTIVTVTLSCIAAIRRRRLRSEIRFKPHPYSWIWSEVPDIFTSTATSYNRVLNLLLIVSILAAAGSAVYAINNPEHNQQYTEFYLLMETNDGNLVAGNYPRNFVTGRSRSLIVGIENHEGEPKQYTVIVELQSMQTSGSSSTIKKSRTLARYTETIENNGTAYVESKIVPQDLTGNNLRLQFLLYQGRVPQNPDPGVAYRKTNLWVNVTSPDSPSPNTNLTRREFSSEEVFTTRKSRAKVGSRDYA